MIGSGTGNKLIIVSIVLFGLYIGQTLIIPFIIAIVVWYLLNSLADLFSKVKIGKRKISRTVQLFFALFLVSVIFIFIVGLVNTNYQMFAEDYPVYHANFLEMTETITEDFNLNFPVLLLKNLHKSSLKSLNQKMIITIFFSCQFD